MDWNRGFTAAYTCYRVDPKTWRDTEEIAVFGGQVDRTDADTAESASLDLREYLQEQWVRVYLVASQDDDRARVPVFTGLMYEPEEVEAQAGTESYTSTCASVLQPAADVLMPRGWYAPVGMSGAEVVRRLLSPSPAPVSVAEGSPSLTTYMVAEDGETNLSMAVKVAAAIGWIIRISGDGSVSIEPPPSEPVARFAPDALNVVIEGVKVNPNRKSVPNVLRVTCDGAEATARDESDGQWSISSRGREVWAEESDAVLSNGESLASYAVRRLEELQTADAAYEYTRSFVPGVRMGDVIDNGYRKLNGRTRVTGQSIELGAGCMVTEEASSCL